MKMNKMLATLATVAFLFSQAVIHAAEGGNQNQFVRPQGGTQMQGGQFQGQGQGQQPRQNQPFVMPPPPPQLEVNQNQGQRAPTVTPAPTQLEMNKNPGQPAPTVTPAPTQQAQGQRVPTPTVPERFRQRFEQAKEQWRNRPTQMQNQQEFQANFQQRKQEFQQQANQVRDQIRRNRPEFKNWFNDEFFEHHNVPFYHQRGVVWWNGSGWNGLNRWLGWGWGYPIYYTVEGYPQPYTNYQEPAGEPVPQAGEWMPLGVFAEGRTSADAATSNRFVQLAINKQGEIAGTYYNSSTDQTHPVVGLVDKETQQIGWHLSDNPNSPMLRTGLYNLTQDVAPAQVIFPDGTQQPWTLVRINQSQSQSQEY